MKIKKATKEHAEWLAENLREADRLELSAVSSKSFFEVIFMSIEASGGDSWTGFDDNGNIMCIGGVVGRSILSECGVPWVIGSDYLGKNKKQFVSISRKWLRVFLGKYKHLENNVDARNKDSIKWLKWLGFKFDEAKPYGFKQMPFHRFSIAASGF